MLTHPIVKDWNPEITLRKVVETIYKLFCNSPPQLPRERRSSQSSFLSNENIQTPTTPSTISKPIRRSISAPHRNGNSGSFCFSKGMEGYPSYDEDMYENESYSEPFEEAINFNTHDIKVISPDKLIKKETILETDQYGLFYGQVGDISLTIEEYKYKHKKEINKAVIDSVDTYSSFNHPNILKIYGYSVQEISSNHISIYVCRENVICTLQTLLLNKTIVLTKDIIKSILLQICDGVIYLHGQNYIHGNISTESIFIVINDDNTYQIKIAGLARNESMNEKGDILLSVHNNHVAPELLAFMEHSFECDVYSLGILLIEIYCHLLCISYFPAVKEDYPCIDSNTLRVYAEKGIKPELPNSIEDKVKLIIYDCLRGQKERPSINTVKQRIQEL
ncbi:hypothetical protein WA158_000559 [Blastocystis sp. Blastoise]